MWNKKKRYLRFVSFTWFYLSGFYPALNVSLAHETHMQHNRYVCLKYLYSISVLNHMMRHGAHQRAAAGCGRKAAVSSTGYPILPQWPCSSNRGQKRMPLSVSTSFDALCCRLASTAAAAASKASAGTSAHLCCRYGEQV